MNKKYNKPEIKTIKIDSANLLENSIPKEGQYWHKVNPCGTQDDETNIENLTKENDKCP